MHHLASTRVLALIFGLAAGAAGTAYAQDTTDMGRATMDTTEAGAAALDTSGVDTSAVRGGTGADTSAQGDTSATSGVRNPPGYRGMERDTTIFPPSDDQQQDAGRIEGQATGTYSDTAWQDTTGADQNPPGYRGMERPAGLDTTRSDTGKADGQDTTGADRDTAGYQGMERSETDTAAHGDTTAVGDTEPRVEDEPTRRLDPSGTGAADTAGQTGERDQ